MNLLQLIGLRKSVIPQEPDKEEPVDKRVILMDRNQVVVIDRAANTMTFMTYKKAD
jgi:hypothetical protein